MVLDDIARFAVTAARVVGRGPEPFFDPDDDDQRRIAKSVLIDLSTAADRLPESFRQQHPDINWSGIRAVRNFIAHDYAGTDIQILWRAIAVEFPRIVAQLESASPMPEE
ncbi:DUF86 domain-containing protein [Microbacterium thalassium]|uniref:Uncharacterized protein with HEPN domain n=1 Tax=Microbacterium thalassium TaxID=362649 RepID=A0A7X0KVX7_9MICO|nr:HepT-like ribonuclease domain-containing protein [Microbacterium thalassium]MBB6392700.1 uncharacterized protein with HEPN domain [Microbacterium thalassium]